MFDATKPKFRNITFEQVDFDQQKDLVEKYQIKSIPHLIFLDAGGTVLYDGGAPQDPDAFEHLIKSK